MNARLDDHSNAQVGGCTGARINVCGRVPRTNSFECRGQIPSSAECKFLRVPRANSFESRGQIFLHGQTFESIPKEFDLDSSATSLEDSTKIPRRFRNRGKGKAQKRQTAITKTITEYKVLSYHVSKPIAKKKIWLEMSSPSA